jgi:voltage-gated potassium channel
MAALSAGLFRKFRRSLLYLAAVFSLRIIARGEHRPTEKKLRQAGADEVVLPASIGGTRIAHSITRPATMEFLGENRGLVGEELKKLGVEIDELRLGKRTQLVGKTILELQEMADGHMLVIALQRRRQRAAVGFH